ncbi:MAG: hypothetical protein JST54_15555 [Deltaproteobacteria bacterium]|nr:hypothetical protein [Deltaproteobacteria bacterium]
MSTPDPKATPEPEIFDNPQFDAPENASSPTVPVPEAKAAETPTTPEPVASAPMPTRTIEVEPVQLPPEAFPEPAPAPPAPSPASTVRVESAVIPPEAIPPAPPVAAPPKATGSSLIPMIAVGMGAFALGVVSTWLVMHKPASERPIVEAPAAPPPAPVVILPAPSTEPATQMVAVPAPEPKHASEPPPAAAGKHGHREVASAPAKAEPAKPEAPKAGAPAKGVLGTYETGDLDAAIHVAQQDHADSLYAKLEGLKNALGTASAAQRSRDLNREVSALETAAQLDASIDRDPGPLRTRIRSRLVQASVEAGNHDAAAHDVKSAAAHYRRALALAPDDAEAKRKLDALGQK